MTAPIIVWFRRDLRVSDNPAFFNAVKAEKPVLPLFIWETDNTRPVGGASKWWLHHSLLSLSKALEELGLKLILRKGNAAHILGDVVTDSGADHVVWNRQYCADAIERDSEIKQNLKARGLTAESFKANLLNEPWSIKNGSGNYYKVFTPYWKSVLSKTEPSPALPIPSGVISASNTVSTLKIKALNLLPTTPDWGAKIQPFWQPGSLGAAQALEHFLDGAIDSYASDRDRPDRVGTSRLSPHLAFGEISPRQIWHAAIKCGDRSAKFLSEIGWREFSYNLIYHNPDLAKANFNDEFDSFEWKENPDALYRWQTGQTGYPLVDAGMRQLWATGWQHNRVRMITASFLIKHLMIDWRDGEAWFWDTLVDADPASNAASWQWVAGSGADASPFFRIFNPIVQGEKFDPNGDYIRKWVPELSGLSAKYIHKPWDTPQDILSVANIVLGETYPEPIVEHKFARERALAAYKKMRG